MKELTLAVRHDDKLAFANFDINGNITGWVSKINASDIEKSTHAVLSHSEVLIVGKTETPDTIKCEVLDTFDFGDEVEPNKNMIDMPGFTYQASELLKLFIESNDYLPDPTENIH